MLFVDIPFAFMIVIIHFAFWRIPFFWSDIRNTIASDGAILCCIYREKTKPLDNCCVSGHRQTIFDHCRYAVCDLVTLPAFLLLMCTWRNVATIGEIRMVYSDAERQVDGSSYCLQGRLCVWRNLGMLFVDIPFAFMIVIIHFAFWRIPFFWSDIRNTIASDGAILCCIYREKTKPLDNCCVSGHRETIFYHFLTAVFDIFSLPMFFLVIVTVYRVPSLVTTFRDVKASATDKRLALAYHFVNIPVDAVVLLVALCTASMLVRLKYLIEDFLAQVRDDRDVWERRRVICVHLILSFRDVLCLLPFGSGAAKHLPRIHGRQRALQ
jgi:hypothetical protein